MKIRKSYRLSPKACNYLSALSHTFRVPETLVLEKSIEILFSLYKTYHLSMSSFGVDYSFDDFCDSVHFEVLGGFKNEF